MDETQAKRYRELRKVPKATLAQWHAANGGVMGVQVYIQWTKEELINAVMEDEQHGAPRR